MILSFMCAAGACEHCEPDKHICEHRCHGSTRPTHLWSCGCLINDAGAHRVGCPDHPEGVRG